MFNLRIQITVEAFILELFNVDTIPVISKCMLVFCCGTLPVCGSDIVFLGADPSARLRDSLESASPVHSLELGCRPFVPLGNQPRCDVHVCNCNALSLSVIYVRLRPIFTLSRTEQLHDIIALLGGLPHSWNVFGNLKANECFSISLIP